MSWQSKPIQRSSSQNHWLAPPADHDELGTQIKNWVTAHFSMPTTLGWKEIRIVAEKQDGNVYSLEIYEQARDA